jgi:hypothetical protein
MLESYLTTKDAKDTKERQKLFTAEDAEGAGKRFCHREERSDVAIPWRAAIVRNGIASSRRSSQ